VLGKVEMNITVSPDGLLKHVEILRGDPLLAEVAHDEAMRWFYFPPFRKCGQPLEGVAREEVDFRGP
jgi:hypothetical protein